MKPLPIGQSPPITNSLVDFPSSDPHQTHPTFHIIIPSPSLWFVPHTALGLFEWTEVVVVGKRQKNGLHIGDDRMNNSWPNGQ
jgi:hypothetical protein